VLIEKKNPIIIWGSGKGHKQPHRIKLVRQKGSQGLLTRRTKLYVYKFPLRQRKKNETSKAKSRQFGSVKKKTEDFSHEHVHVDPARKAAAPKETDSPSSSEKKKKKATQE